MKFFINNFRIIAATVSGVLGIILLVLSPDAVNHNAASAYCAGIFLV